MKTLLVFATLSAVGIVWAVSHTATSRLQGQLHDLLRENSELLAVRDEKERLQRMYAAATWREAEGQVAASSVQATAQITTAANPAFVIGEWRPPTSWQNRGQATPVDTIETALWWEQNFPR
jgi:hypothetical protein